MKTEKNRKYQREWAAKRTKNSKYIFLPCKYCGNKTQTKEYKRTHYARLGGITCKSCRAKISSKVMTKLQLSLTPKERSQRAKKASEKADKSKAVYKQWENIKNNPKKFKQIKEKRRLSSIQMWKNFDDKTRNKIIAALVGSKNNKRSKLSDLVKQCLIDHKIYDGFQSEQLFYGLIPDEINHKLKTIIEVFGDAYHCSPRKYKNLNEFIPLIGRTVQEQRERDDRRIKLFKDYGYITIIIWEKDFLNSRKKTMNRIIKTIKQRQKENII